MKIKDIILIVLILMVVSMGGYLLYDKVLRDDSVVNNENKDDSLNESKEDNNSDTNEGLDNSNTNGSSSNLIDMNSYKNADGTYGFIKVLNFSSGTLSTSNWNYSLNLSLDGNVYIKENGRSQKISNISNAIDMADFYHDVGFGPLGNAYILISNGDIFRYKEEDFLENKYLGIKVMNVPNAQKLIEIGYCPWADAGCCNNLSVLTSDGKLIKLGGRCV